MEHLSAIAAYFDLKTLIIMALIFVPLERLFAARPGQAVLRPTLRVDLFYLFVINQLTRVFLAIALIAVVAGVKIMVPAEVAATVQSQPLWLQFAEALLVFDTGTYLAHRTFHAVPFLWRFHAIHHSSEQLDWISSFRNHPVDLMISRLMSLLPIFALGFSADAVLVLLVFQQAHSAIVHANVRTDFGPLRRFIVSPHFHHWHHADHRSSYDKNFAGQLAFLDWVGGTLHRPESDFPVKYGADGAPPADNPLRQLVDPLRPSPIEVKAPISATVPS